MYGVKKGTVTQAVLIIRASQVEKRKTENDDALHAELHFTRLDATAELAGGQFRPHLLLLNLCGHQPTLQLDFVVFAS